MLENKEERKRKKSAAKESKMAEAAATAKAKTSEDGYETDTGTTGKSKSKLRKKHRAQSSNDGGYETDDGYVSSSTKKLKTSRSFFRLGNKSRSNVDDKGPEPPMPPPLPPVPPVQFRLPIAERFATTLKFDADDSAVLEPPPSVLPAVAAGYSTSSASTPTSGSIPTPISPRDTDRESIDALESPVAHDLAQSTSKRSRGLHFASSSDSSDHHGSSSGGHSIFSRITGSSSGSSTASHPAPIKKPPVISFPLTRSPSPPSPPPNQLQHIPTYTSSPKKHVPNPLSLAPHSGAAPPSPPAGSPFVLLTPVDAASPPPSEPEHPRPRNRIFGRPLPELICTTPNHPVKPTIVIPTVIHQDSDETVTEPQASSEVVPSMEYVVPSPLLPPSPRIGIPPSPRHGAPPALPRLIPPSTQMFTQHDIPPPSPPPIGPLPDIPNDIDSAVASGGGGSGGYFASLQTLPVPQQPATSPSRSPSPQPGRRGVESPFPAPVRPPPAGDFQARVKVPRYRELYALALPSENISPSASSNPTPTDSDDELHNVLARFKAQDEDDIPRGSALERMRSIEASSRSRMRRVIRVEGPDEDQEEDDVEDDDRSNYSRPSTYQQSTSVSLNPNSNMLYAGDRNQSMQSVAYSFGSDAESRSSMLDPQKSEEARKRFLKRIEGMFDADGRELLPPKAGENVPPVPRIPTGLVGGGARRRNNRNGGWF